MIRTIVAITLAAVLLACGVIVFAGAREDVSIVVIGECASPDNSHQIGIANANSQLGVIVTLQETRKTSQKTDVSNFDVSLAPSETKMVGCESRAFPEPASYQYAIVAARYYQQTPDPIGVPR